MKTKNILLFAICIACTSNCYSQNWLWAKRAGGADFDLCRSISADVGGNVFVTGYFNSPAIAFGSTTLTNFGNTNAFIAKYGANGTVLWAKSTGGTGDEFGLSVSADAGGNVFVTGWFDSPTLIFGSTTLTNAGVYNAFIAKYDSIGNALWAKSVGGTGRDVCYSVSADVGGNVFVTGNFNSPTITFGSTTVTNAGNYNVFIAKYDASEKALGEKGPPGKGGKKILPKTKVVGEN